MSKMILYPKKIRLQNAIKYYKERWGNYKSDKYKTYRTLRAEITDLLVCGNLSRKELIEIKEFIKEKAFI